MAANIVVSVVIPTFNRPALLARALDSLHKQTMREFEVLVVDDGSDPEVGYGPVLEKYRALLPGLRTLANRGRKGAPSCRNTGIREAAGEFVALLDDDDAWTPEKLAAQLEVFRGEAGNIGLVYTWAPCIDVDGSRAYTFDSTLEGRPMARLLEANFIPASSVMASRKALFAAGLFDEDLPSCQDWDLWVRILAEGYECRVVRRELTLYFKQPTASIGTSPRAMIGYRKFYGKHFLRYLGHGMAATVLKRLAYASIRSGFRA